MLKQGPDFHFEISGNFKISEFEIMRFDCIFQSLCCVYSFDLPQQVEAIRMSTHDICFHKVYDLHRH